MEIKLKKEENRIVAYDNKKEIGECQLIETEDGWNIIHTGVDSKYQGQGIAKKLVECVIENSEKYHKKLIAQCSYAKKVIENRRSDRRNLKAQIENYKPYNEQEEKDKEMMIQYINTFEDVVTRKNKMCHFTASNWIVNQERTKVLMIYHNIYKSWAWTGGHADGNSDLWQVALKEAKEETGLQDLKTLSNGIYGIQILTVDSHRKRGEFIPSHLHLDCCFLLEADETEVLKIKKDENSGVKWIDIDKAVDITKEENMKPIYRKLNEKLANYVRRENG